MSPREFVCGLCGRTCKTDMYDQGDQETYSGVAMTDREMEKTRLFYTSGHPVVGRLRVVEYGRTTMISWEDNDRSEAALDAWRKRTGR